MKCEFLMSAAAPKDLPKSSLPEIAFFGRSNVGKSSIINALTGRTNLARKSREPGRTRLANFFSIADDHLLIDLPGYGFAKVTQQERLQWQELMDAYLARKTLATCVVLVDIRRTPDELDFSVVDVLPKKCHKILVFTKSDKVSKQEAMKLSKAIKSEYQKNGCRFEKEFIVSALKKTGVPELLDYLLQTPK